MGLNLFDVFHSVAIIILIDAQVVPSLTNRSLFRLTPETLFHESNSLFNTFLAISGMANVLDFSVHFLFCARNQLFFQEALVPSMIMVF